MRSARLQDYRRRIKERIVDWPIKLKTFKFENITTLGTGEIVFQSPLTVFAGPNGVGKTTLLRAIWATADPENVEMEQAVAQKLNGGVAALTFTSDAKEGLAKISIAAGKVQSDGGAEVPLDNEVIHLDMSLTIKRQQEEFCKFESIEVLLNGVGGKLIDEKTSSEINYMARRDYREIKLYEIEQDGDVVPFFEVAYEDDRYDSRTMGTGEMAILNLWWAIQRAPKSSLILIEEPETYLSAGAQEALIHFMLMATVDKHLFVVIASHSPKIIENVSDDQLVFIFRKNGGVSILPEVAPIGLLNTMGIEPQIKAVALIEDKGAGMFLRRILERHEPNFSRSVELSERGGEGKVVALLKELNGHFKGLKIVGVLDGDMRGKAQENVAKSLSFLPGDKPIEKLLREMIQANSKLLVTATGRQDIEATLYGLQGKDHHDWYEELCKHLGLTKESLFSLLFGIWENQEGNAEASRKAVDEFLLLLE